MEEFRNLGWLLAAVVAFLLAFLAVKIAGMLTWSWWLIATPFWLWLGVVIISLAVVLGVLLWHRLRR